jgi:hypothetical protein
MLVLDRSILNKEYTLINVLRTLASIISMCNLHVTFLSKITRRHTVYEWNVLSSIRWDSGGQQLREK